MILLQILRLKNIKVPAAAHFGHQGCVGKHLRDASDPLCRAFVLFCSSDSSVLTQLPTMKMDENGGKAMTLQEYVIDKYQNSASHPNGHKPSKWQELVHLRFSEFEARSC